MDDLDYTSSGIPVIATDTDAASRLGTNNPNSATPGTITEQCIDVMTVSYQDNSVRCARIGRGKNRYINGGIINLEIGGTTMLTSRFPSVTQWKVSDDSVATVENGRVVSLASGKTVVLALNDSGQEFWCIVVGGGI